LRPIFSCREVTSATGCANNFVNGGDDRSDFPSVGYMKANAGALLLVTDHAEKVLRLRIAPRAEHADETPGGCV
jgi:hypothetical protein